MVQDVVISEEGAKQEPYGILLAVMVSLQHGLHLQFKCGHLCIIPEECHHLDIRIKWQL